MTHQQKSPAELAGDVLRASRRQVLCGTGFAAMAAVLAACGVADEGDGGNKTPTSAPSGPLATLDQVPVGGGIVAGNLVIVQPTQGVVKAYNRSCPHAHNPVDAPEKGVITCPFHGSKFKVEDGSRISGPAETGLTEVPVKVDNGQILAA